MKKLHVILIILFMGMSCKQTDDIFEENFIRGGFVQFTEPVETFNLSLLGFENIEFSAQVKDPNNNVESYALSLQYQNIVVNNFIVLNQLPGTVAFTGSELLDALNIKLEDLEASSSIRFTATVTTNTGVFSGLRPSFNTNTNAQTGGDTASEIFASNLNQAMDFSFKLFVPPPKKLRGTSFEEPFGAPLGSDYTRPSGDANLTAELLNNPGERHVMHTAVGNGVDDEIGFRTFFIADPTNTGTSPGFTSEEIGVSSDPEEVGGAFLDGNQAYQIEDTDGIIRIEFDRVEVDAALHPTSGVQIQYLAADTGNNREKEDFLVISALVEKTDGTTETFYLVDIDGLGINRGIGVWSVASTGFMDNIVAYTLTIDVNVNGPTEDIYFDQMLVFIPEN